MFQTEKVNSLLFSGTCIKGEVHSSMAIFFTLKKSLYNDMLFTKILASNELLRTFALIVYAHPYCARNSCRNAMPKIFARTSLNPTKSFSEVTQNSATERCHLGAGNVCVTSKSSA